jgi:hypothetical protein
MANERFFKMLSVAVLGLLALAVVPETQAIDSQTELTIEQVPVEVTVVREVDEINAGRFNRDLFATSTDEDTSLVLSPVKTTTLTQFDPNL